jgi:hypothetical protein
MDQLVEGVFEVVDSEERVITVRHCATGHEFEITLGEGAASKFLEVLPIGTHYFGSMTIEEPHYC